MRRLGLIPILLVALPVAAGAQINIPAPERHGFWLGGGLGYAGAKLSCGLCATEDSRIGGVSGYLRAGYTLSPAFLLGAEVDVWSGSATPESDSDTTLSRFVGTLFATAYWYPSAKIGLFLKGGAGMVSFRRRRAHRQRLRRHRRCRVRNPGRQERLHRPLRQLPRFVQRRPDLPTDGRRSGQRQYVAIGGRGHVALGPPASIRRPSGGASICSRNCDPGHS